MEHIIQECKRCVNTNANPTITLSDEGLCSVCEMFQANLDESALVSELESVRKFIGSGRDRHDALIGMSGGKDSSSTAFLVRELGFHPIGFTFNTGYYPDHIPERAKEIADRLSFPHEQIDIRKYVTEAAHESYRLTAEVFEMEEDDVARRAFRRLYGEARKHYSVKDDAALPFVRTCILCRKTVIRAYYGEAIRHGIRVVVLGMNEWTGLARTASSGNCALSGIRALRPQPGLPVVYVVHLPFILRLKRQDVEGILGEIRWKAPEGESFVETNSNSCLFARAAEGKSQRLLGFHPDSTRLAREVTAGFISKADAEDALLREHLYPRSVRDVLIDAGLVRSGRS